jgi:CBS domain-containing protein
VSDLMSTSLITINVGETLKEAHAEMQVGVVRHLPVVDDHRRIVGILSDRDILRALATKKAQRVGDFMTREVVTILPDAPAHQAATMMLDLKISSLPVVDETQTLVGLITQTDYVEVAHRALVGLPLER